MLPMRKMLFGEGGGVVLDVIAIAFCAGALLGSCWLLGVETHQVLNSGPVLDR